MIGEAPVAGKLSTTCCIAGGGPAGMVLGLLLARAGIDVVVLEKHADFLRDFRGDTIHPSTLEVMDELGLLDDLLKLPHNKVARLGVQVGDTSINFADFTWLPPRYAFIALMPQWDFLDFLADEARTYPNFKLIMQANVVDLIEEDGRVVGVRAHDARGPARSARQAHRRLRRPQVDGARQGRARGGGHRRTDRRVLDARLAPA